MARKIIVVTAAYGNDHVKSLGGQAAVLPFIANAGADGVEIRRELCSAEELNALPSLAATIERHGLLACYSAPQALFTDNGELNPDLPTLLAEAQTLNALWLKLSLGHFLHNQQLDELRDILSDSGMALVVENDQTDCGQLAPMQRFKAACRVHQLPITLTFDMGNWLWVGDSPEEAARLTRLMRMNYETMHLFAMSRMERARCLTIMNEYYRLHLPNFPVLKSLEVLKELFD